MRQEVLGFLSHAPIGSLCSLGSLRSLPVISHVRFITKEKPNQKQRSCPPSQQRTLRPFPYTSAIRQYYAVLAELGGLVLGILPVCTGNISALSIGFTGAMLSVFDTTR